MLQKGFSLYNSEFDMYYSGGYMKKCILLLLLSSFIFFLFAQLPTFKSPVPVKANGANINTGFGGNASPFMCDWDEDGKKDLLLGTFMGDGVSGSILFYPNTGEDNAPVFGDHTLLKADGNNISVSCG